MLHYVTLQYITVRYVTLKTIKKINILPAGGHLDPKMAQDGANLGPKRPKIAQDGPKMARDWAQEVPSWGLTPIGGRLGKQVRPTIAPGAPHARSIILNKHTHTPTHTGL